MPYKSKAQMRKFFAMEADGEIPKGTAKQWADETKNIKKLPERVKKAGLKKVLKAIWSPGTAMAKKEIRRYVPPMVMDGNMLRQHPNSARILVDSFKQELSRGKKIDIAARIGYGALGAGGVATAVGMKKKALDESFAKIAKGLKKLPPVPTPIVEQQEAISAAAEKRKGLNPVAARVAKNPRLS